MRRGSPTAAAKKETVAYESWMPKQREFVDLVRHLTPKEEEELKQYMEALGAWLNGQGKRPSFGTITEEAM